MCEQRDDRRAESTSTLVNASWRLHVIIFGGKSNPRGDTVGGCVIGKRNFDKRVDGNEYNSHHQKTKITPGKVEQETNVAHPKPRHQVK